jgi:hypothetical protein
LKIVMGDEDDGGTRIIGVLPSIILKSAARFSAAAARLAGGAEEDADDDEAAPRWRLRASSEAASFAELAACGRFMPASVAAATASALVG